MAAAALFGILVQAVGVYCYSKGHWDRLRQSVDAAPARPWNWRANPILRTAQAGFAWEPDTIIATGIQRGPAATARKRHDLGINPY